MKRYITYYLSIILALSVFTSCEGEVFQIAFESKEDNVLTLRISTDKLTSRATIDGEDANNENLINTLDCFFYISATDSAVCRKTVSDLSYKGSDIHEISISFDDDEMKELFGSNYKTVPARNECLVYVIANLPSGVTVWNDATIKSLKERTLAGDFTQSEEITVSETKKKVSKIQTNFVMDSDGVDNDDNHDVVTLTVDNNLASLSGHVPLYRAAAKVGLFVYVPESIRNGEGNNQTIWSPVPGSMEVKFHNGLKRGNIDNTTTPYTTITDNDYFETDRIYFDVTNSEVAANGITYNQTTSVPFYSYPTSAAKGTYFILYLSWQEMEETTNDGETVLKGKGVFKNCFYQIPINKLEALVRNNYYRLLLNVGVLGTESGMVELTPSYTVCEWNTEDINTKIEENVYLVVDEEMVYIYNKNSYAVSYVSSHDIEVQILSIKQPNFLGKEETTTIYYDFDEDDENAPKLNRIEAGTEGLYREFSVNVVGNTVVLNHEIINKGEETEYKEYDIAPYTVEVRVTMTFEDASGKEHIYEEDITFKQYPAIYVEANLNSDYKGGASGENGSNGYVYVNGYQKEPDNGNNTFDSFPFRYNDDSSQKQQFFGTANGYSTRNTNSNPNMYTINISSFSNNEYIIGDPRTLSYTSLFTNNYDNEGNDDGTQTVAENTDELKFNNGNRNVWFSAPALYDGSTNRRLKYYYPTDASDNTKNMIAPKIKVASSYSVVTSGFLYHKEAARRRCASYQEDGYPAGRWRLPTFAEAKYMVELSAEGKIPALFSTGATYWCAQGSFIPNNNNGTVTPDSNDYYENDGGNSVRCVYDEWYWGSEAPLTGNKTFTWGDYPRDAWPPSGN